MRASIWGIHLRDRLRLPLGGGKLSRSDRLGVGLGGEPLRARHGDRAGKYSGYSFTIVLVSIAWDFSTNARNDIVSVWFNNDYPHKTPRTPIQFVIPRERSDRGNLPEGETQVSATDNNL